MVNGREEEFTWRNRRLLKIFHAFSWSIYDVHYCYNSCESYDIRILKLGDCFLVLFFRFTIFYKLNRFKGGNFEADFLHLNMYQHI